MWKSLKRRSWQDSNLQSLDPKTNPLPIGPHDLTNTECVLTKYFKWVIFVWYQNTSFELITLILSESKALVYDYIWSGSVFSLRSYWMTFVISQFLPNITFNPTTNERFTYLNILYSSFKRKTVITKGKGWDNIEWTLYLLL